MAGESSFSSSFVTIPKRSHDLKLLHFVIYCRSNRFNDRRRSPPRYSRSPPPRRGGRTRSRSRDNNSPPPRRHQSRYACLNLFLSDCLYRLKTILLDPTLFFFFTGLSHHKRGDMRRRGHTLVHHRTMAQGLAVEVMRR